MHHLFMLYSLLYVIWPIFEHCDALGLAAFRNRSLIKGRGEVWLQMGKLRVRNCLPLPPPQYGWSFKLLTPPPLDPPLYIH